MSDHQTNDSGRTTLASLAAAYADEAVVVLDKREKYIHVRATWSSHGYVVIERTVSPPDDEIEVHSTYMSLSDLERILREAKRAQRRRQRRIDRARADWPGTSS